MREVSVYPIARNVRLQGYLAHKKTLTPKTLPWAYASGPRGVLGGYAFSYERGTPVVGQRRVERTWSKPRGKGSQNIFRTFTCKPRPGSGLTVLNVPSSQQTSRKTREKKRRSAACRVGSKSQLASRNQLWGLMFCKFGHVTLKLCRQRNPQTPLCGSAGWACVPKTKPSPSPSGWSNHNLIKRLLPERSGKTR